MGELQLETQLIKRNTAWFIHIITKLNFGTCLRDGGFVQCLSGRDNHISLPLLKNRESISTKKTRGQRRNINKCEWNSTVYGWLLSTSFTLKVFKSPSFLRYCVAWQQRQDGRDYVSVVNSHRKDESRLGAYHYQQTTLLTFFFFFSFFFFLRSFSSSCRFCFLCFFSCGSWLLSEYYKHLKWLRTWLFK